MDHYSCNEIVRPRNESELKKMVEYQRHAVLLYHDAVAAKYAQYEGYFFNDLCEVDLRDGSRGYAPQYQFETFCHNNPGFLDMHQKYLRRLMKEVPIDGIEVDDMCNYPGPTTAAANIAANGLEKNTVTKYHLLEKNLFGVILPKKFCNGAIMTILFSGIG